MRRPAGLRQARSLWVEARSPEAPWWSELAFAGVSSPPGFGQSAAGSGSCAARMTWRAPGAAMLRASGRSEAGPGSRRRSAPESVSVSASKLRWMRPETWPSRKAARCSDRGSGWNRDVAPGAWSSVRKSRGRRQGRSWAWPDHRAGGVRPQARPHALGSATQKVAPSPGAEITPIEPPCNSTNRLARARPTPCPSTVERSRPRRLKGSNSCACF